jgi:hypothetical protein
MRCFQLGAGTSGGTSGSASTGAVKDIVSNWVGRSRDVASAMIKKYGVPDEATDSRLIWGPRGVWNEIVVYREPVFHNWPTPHVDVLEQSVNYQYPLDRYDDVVMFDGSVSAERTKGVLKARCDSEAGNYLALNLAHEIATNRRAWQDCREFYEQVMMNASKGLTHSYLTGLIFTPAATPQGDPDNKVF